MSLYLIPCQYSISSIRHAHSSFSPDMPLISCILSNLLFLGELSPTVSSPPDLAGQYASPVQFRSVQSLSCVQLFATPWSAVRHASLSITNSRSSLRLTSIEAVMPSSHLILCHPWISLQSKGLSRVFSNTTVQKHQFFGTQLSSQSNSHIHTWPPEKP